jgi:hypothetical protein
VDVHLNAKWATTRAVVAAPNREGWGTRRGAWKPTTRRDVDGQPPNEAVQVDG